MMRESLSEPQAALIRYMIRPSNVAVTLRINALRNSSKSRGTPTMNVAWLSFSAFMMDSAVMSCAKTAIALMDIGMTTLAING